MFVVLFVVEQAVNERHLVVENGPVSLESRLLVPRGQDLGVLDVDGVLDGPFYDL